MTRLLYSVTAVVVAAAVTIAMKVSPPESAQPEELGRVQWERDLDRGLARAKKQEKDIFLLFQEVPG